MNLKITEQKDNPLLLRKEIQATLTYDAATPSTKDLHSQLASGLKVKPELLVVKHILPQFGTRVADVLVYQYESEEQLKKVEGVKEKIEDKPKEEPAPAEKKEDKPAESKEDKAESAKEEKQEDKKEEPKEEPKEGK
jgi:ribosomal protein S24E